VESADAAVTETATETTTETAEATEASRQAPSPSTVTPASVETTASPSATRPRRSDRPIQTVGRRKEAIVRVRLMPGSGKFTLNGRTLEGYFPSKVHQQLVKDPLVTADKAETFDVFANLRGGGTTGQAGALRLAIARALCESEPDDRPALKKAGFLTRDARVKERKKYGLKKARKAPQYSKR
jgi:small subunit ribosomal protein S9